MPNIHLSVLDMKYIKSSSFDVVQNDIDALNRLQVDLISKTSKPKLIRDRMDLIRMIKQENFRLVVARDIDLNSHDEPSIVGMATIHWIELLTKINAYVDDVVVLETYQGQKIGKKLMLELIRIAREVCAHCVDLTSNSTRTVANKMYVNMGFEKKNTNYYRLKL